LFVVGLFQTRGAYRGSPFGNEETGSGCIIKYLRKKIYTESMEHSLFTLYYSDKCPHSRNLLQGVKNLPNLDKVVNKVNILTSKFPNSVKSVPAVQINSSNELLTGKRSFEWLESEQNTSVNAFEDGFGSSLYSSITSDNLGEQQQQSFTYLNDFQQNEEVTHKDSRMEQLLNERDSEIPQPRQRI
jgi:hypothetical protein